jgi:hypothetical protein
MVEGFAFSGRPSMLFVPGTPRPLSFGLLGPTSVGEEVLVLGLMIPI